MRATARHCDTIFWIFRRRLSARARVSTATKFNSSYFCFPWQIRAPFSLFLDRRGMAAIAGLGSRLHINLFQNGIDLPGRRSQHAFRGSLFPIVGQRCFKRVFILTLASSRRIHIIGLRSSIRYRSISAIRIKFCHKDLLTVKLDAGRGLFSYRYSAPFDIAPVSYLLAFRGRNEDKFRPMIHG